MQCGARVAETCLKGHLPVYRCVRFPACDGWEPVSNAGDLAWPVQHTETWQHAHAAAHEAFDPLWSSWVAGFGSAPSLAHQRVRCYEWLAVRLEKSLGACHLALLSVDELHEVVTACTDMTTKAVNAWWLGQKGVHVQTGVLVPTGIQVAPMPYWSELPLRVRLALGSYGIKSAKLAVQVACGELKLPQPLRADLLDVLQGELLLLGAVRGPTLAEMKAKPKDVSVEDFLASRRALVRYETLKQFQNK